MPGPAIRAWHLAEALGQQCDVVLASTVAASGAHPSAEVRLAADGALPRLVEASDVVFAPSGLVYSSRALRDAAKPLVVDIYDPYHLENLEMGGDGLAEHDRSVTRLVGVINASLRRGDFFTCASERQRDFWLGSLAALGRVNPYTYEGDPLLRRLVAAVPFGLPVGPPRRDRQGLRGVMEGIGPDDKVVLWGGGVYNWLDPVSVLRAVDSLRRRVPELRLVFLGMRHPNPAIPEMAVATELQAASASLGLTGKHVFFNPGWVPYERRAEYLLDADVAVSTHLDHIETRYSFRSRVMDYIWAGLPMVLTGGDTLAAEITGDGVGVAVQAGDDRALAEGLERMLAEPPPPERFARLQERYRWDRVAQPLVEFCRAPTRAPDLVVERHSPEVAAGEVPATAVAPMGSEAPAPAEAEPVGHAETQPSEQARLGLARWRRRSAP
jgi:glycosyltransferase involved in cell wall biosynthesis